MQSVHVIFGCFIRMKMSRLMLGNTQKGYHVIIIGCVVQQLRADVTGFGGEVALVDL